LADWQTPLMALKQAVWLVSLVLWQGTETCHTRSLDAMG
jgi:hypothetical protein